MADRICLGERAPAHHGFFVSRDGSDVLTADASDLMITTDRKAFQIVASGIIMIPSNDDRTIVLPDLGFEAHFLCAIQGGSGSGNHLFWWEYLNTTTIQLNNGNSISAWCGWLMLGLPTS